MTEKTSHLTEKTSHLIKIKSHGALYRVHQITNLYQFSQYMATSNQN